MLPLSFLDCVHCHPYRLHLHQYHQILHQNSAARIYVATSMFRHRQQLLVIKQNLFLVRQQVFPKEIFLISQYLYTNNTLNNVLHHHRDRHVRFPGNNFLRILGYHDGLQNVHRVYQSPFQMLLWQLQPQHLPLRTCLDVLHVF